MFASRGAAQRSAAPTNQQSYGHSNGGPLLPTQYSQGGTANGPVPQEQQQQYGVGSGNRAREEREAREAEAALQRVIEESKRDLEPDFDGALAYALSAVRLDRPACAVAIVNNAHLRRTC